MRATQHLSIGFGALALAASLAIPAPTAGQIPVPGASTVSGQGEWIRYQRVLADSLVRDLITVLERADHDGLARLFTDRGNLTDATGQSASGRAAVEELLERLPPRAGYRAQVSAVTAAPRLVHIAGRTRFDGPDGRGSELFDMLLERHRGWWQIRTLAFAPADDVLVRAPLRGSVAPREGRVPLPERALVRVVVEPVFAREQLLNEDPGSRWTGYGAGVGIEFNRTLEFRGFGRTYSGDTRGQEVINYGGEARLYLFDLWRVRPFLTAGASWFKGDSAPDSAWVPTAGGGLSVRLLPYLDAQLSLRDHLVTTPDGIEEENWLSEKRSHRAVLSAGLSLGLGHRPGWRDDSPTESQRAYETANSGVVLAHVNALLNALEEEAVAPMDSFYGVGARLYFDGDLHRTTPDIFGTLREAGVAPSGQVGQLRISDGVAYFDMMLDDDASRHLFTVLVREDREWRIQFQVLPGA